MGRGRVMREGNTMIMIEESGHYAPRLDAERKYSDMHDTLLVS